MKTNHASYLKQLQNELALVKTSIDNKFNLEATYIELRNSIHPLLEKIKEVKRKISNQKHHKDIEKPSQL
jgi:hypothetical protein